MIQNVESFGMELQADALAQWEFTMQRRVYLPRSKAISRKKRQLVTDDLIEPKCVGLSASPERIRTDVFANSTDCGISIRAIGTIGKRLSVRQRSDCWRRILARRQRGYGTGGHQGERPVMPVVKMEDARGGRRRFLRSC